MDVIHCPSLSSPPLPLIAPPSIPRPFLSLSLPQFPAPSSHCPSLYSPPLPLIVPPSIPHLFLSLPLPLFPAPSSQGTGPQATSPTTQFYEETWFIVVVVVGGALGLGVLVAIIACICCCKCSSKEGKIYSKSPLQFPNLLRIFSLIFEPVFGTYSEGNFLN